MPVDLTAVDWVYVVLLAVLVFIAALIGNFVSFGRRVLAAVIATAVFSGLFVYWTYYPHRVPGPRAVHLEKPVTPPPPPPVTAAPPANTAPSNPVRDITPPAPPAR